MVSIFDVIRGDLRTLSLQTELLEACDWDEALVEEFSSCLSCAMHFAENECPKNYDTMFDMIVEVLLLNGYNDTHVQITRKMMEHHKQEIKQMMELQEQ